MRGRDVLGVEQGLDLWLQSTQDRLELREKYPEDLFLVIYENLVQETETVMRQLVQWLDLDWDDIVLRPTFNRMPIKANSSYPVSEHGILTSPLERWREVLTEDEAARVDERTRDLYEAAVSAAGHSELHSGHVGAHVHR
jgi:hypothetical protein